MFCNKIKRQNISLLILLVNRCGQRKITLLTTRVIQTVFKVKFLLCFIILIYRSEYGIQQQEGN